MHVAYAARLWTISGAVPMPFGSAASRVLKGRSSAAPLD
jgi:hypothetical protein